jgi:indole-3-glycerol phosphate synthase
MNRNFLAEIIAAKRERIFLLREQLGQLRRAAAEVRGKAKPHRLRKALVAKSPQIKVIAEFKRRSPSAGTLHAGASPGEIAAGYEKEGACALSVLTEEDYFGGSLADLAAVRAATVLPILRKDFIIDASQIFESAKAGADAVLLIVAALNDDSLQTFRLIAENELQLDALVEVHDPTELERALRCGANLIGVNNRDLNTLQVSVNTSEILIQAAPRDRTLISESRLRDAGTLRYLQQLGYAGFLIGEMFMRADDPAAALRDLLRAAQNRSPALSP